MVPIRKPSTSVFNLTEWLTCTTNTHYCSIVKLGTNDALTDPFSKDIRGAERSVRFLAAIIQI